MATGNFYKVNLDNYYVIKGDYEEELEDTNNNIYYDLEKSLKQKSYKDYNIISMDKTSPNSLQSFYRHNFIDIYFTYKNHDIDIMVNYNNGYYEGANFDIDIMIDGYNVNIDDNDAENIIYSEKVQKIIKLIEKVLNRYTTRLGVKARFSNGETWYEKK